MEDVKQYLQWNTVWAPLFFKVSLRLKIIEIVSDSQKDIKNLPTGILWHDNMLMIKEMSWFCFIKIKSVFTG